MSAALPSVFISHGSPMHALDAGAAGEAWAALGRSLPRPRAIVIVAARAAGLLGAPDPQPARLGANLRRGPPRRLRARVPGLGGRAHPSEEHFLPLFFALGAAAPEGASERLYGGIEGGALAMDAWLFRPGKA